jgi:hypothetical protein
MLFYLTEHEKFLLFVGLVGLVIVFVVVFQYWGSNT